MGFLSRIFKGKKTKPTTTTGNNKNKNKNGNNNSNKENDDHDVPIRGDKTWPDDLDEHDDGLTLNSGTTMDDPQYRGIYSRPRGMSGNVSYAGATLDGEESTFRSLGENSSLSTYNTGGGTFNRNLGGQQQQQQQKFLLSGIPKSRDSNNSDSNTSNDENRLLFSDGQVEIQHGSSGSNGTNNNMILIDVTLPSGKVGMVLNTPDDEEYEYSRHRGIDSAPVVYQVKPTCPVRGEVHVDDRLVAIDGQDCTHLTAIQASRILSTKSNQPKRVLTLARREIM